MNESTENEVAVARMGLAAKSVAIFTEPAKVFENLRVKADWLFPYLLMLLVAIIFSLSTRSYLLDFQREAINNNSLIPEQYKDKAIENLENKSVARQNIEAVIGGTVQVTLAYLLIAGVLFVVGNFILGGKSTYKHVLSMYSWAGLIGVLELLVKLPMVHLKGSLQVYTSLALLMDPAKAKTPLFILLNAFDLFTIWKIILLGLGFQIIYQFSKAKAFTAVIVLYGLYLGASMGLATIF